MTDENCGYEDTTSGEPCKRTAGWGRDVDEGYCKDHADDDDGGDSAHRPTKLSHARQESIATMIEQGHSINASCRSNGIHRESFYNWMRKGEEQEEGEYADFFDRLTRALGEGERMYENLLLEIARENEDAATVMSMLKQRYPESWGDVNRGEQSGSVVVHTDAAETTEIDPDSLEVVDDP